jgi:FkbM family methyltransferase
MYIPQWLKYLYRTIPLRRSLLIAMREVYVPKYELSQRLNFAGPFRVKAGKRSFLLQTYDDYDHVIENQIFWQGLTGRWEKKSLQLWIDLCKNAKTIFDIGANTGIYALAAQAVNPDAHVFAFEPVARIYSELQHNVRMNKYPIHCIPHALSSVDGTQVMYEREDIHDYTATLNRDFIENQFAGVKYRSIQLQTIKLATFIKGENVPPIDLMKIDVETHEFDVLKGMDGFLDTMRPTLIIEILNDAVGQSIERLLENKGYVIFAIDEHDGPAKVDSLRARNPTNYLLCNSTKAHELELTL